jgi:hypothetical protein
VCKFIEKEVDGCSLIVVRKKNIRSNSLKPNSQHSLTNRYKLVGDR